MAAWQFKIEFLPRAWAVKNSFDSRGIQNSNGYDTSDAWLANQPPTEFKELLSDILPSSTSWHVDLLFWGDTQTDDIQVWYQDEIVSNITLRIDLRRNPAPIFKNAIDVARKLDCIWFYPEHKRMAAVSEQDAFVAITTSSSASFVGLNSDNYREFWSRITD